MIRSTITVLLATLLLLVADQFCQAQRGGMGGGGMGAMFGGPADPVPAFTKLLVDKQRDVREKVAAAVELLSDKDPKVRIHAAGMLGHISDKDPRIRAYAIAAYCATRRRMCVACPP